MDIMLEKLAELGADVKDGLNRFMENEPLYVRCLKKFPPQADQCTLHDDLMSKNYEAAVKSAHTMKGLTGNLSITPLYTRYSEIVSRIRAGETEGLETIEAEIAGIQEQICAVIQEG